MCAWNFTFFASLLLQHYFSFASSSSSLPSLSCFPLKAEVTVKERLEDWFSKVFGEAFPFEKEPRVEEEEDRIKKDEKDEDEEGQDVERGILRLRGKTGFFELDQVL